MTAERLTDSELEAALKRALRDKSDEWLPDGTGRGEGRLLFRAQPTGGRWYFRYTLPDGSRDTLSLGSYAKPGRTKAASEDTGARFSLAQARSEAKAMGELLKDPATSNLRLYRDQQSRKQAAAEAHRREEERRADEARGRTLKRLCELYCAHLEAQGRLTAKKVRQTLEKHVHPRDVASLEAREVGRTDITALISSIQESGPRVAGLVRSYLHAAYKLAMQAEGDPSAPKGLAEFRIEANPVAGVKASAVKKRRRYLSPAELRAWLKYLDAHPGLVADLLRLVLLSGGQRPQQAMRARIKDYDTEEKTLLLWDAKGKRNPGDARPHLVPLGPNASALVGGLVERAKSLGTDLLFSSTGRTAMDIATPSSFVTDASRELVESKDAVEPFQMKDIRRTVETMMAAMGIGKDIRSHLLSHGLTGIQDQRYDMHDYISEKRAALRRWERRVADIEAGKASGKVVPIRGKTAA